MVLVGTWKEIKLLKDIRADGRIVESALQKCSGGCWLKWTDWGLWPVAGCYEGGNELSDFIKGGKFFS